MKSIKQIKLLKVLSFLLLLMALSCNDNDIFISEAIDSDGDGILNSLDEAPNDPCLPAQQAEYTGFDVFNETWANADCDGDGLSNGLEFEDKTRNPLLDENTVDTDGDGVADFIDEDANDPCLPVKEEGYTGFNSNNEIWGRADCDGDSVTNLEEVNNGTDPYKPCNLDFDFSNFEGELQSRDSNNGENIISATFLESCNELSISGDFLNLGCTNEDIEFIVFLEPFVEGGNEGNALIEDATFNCTNEAGETIEYTFNASGFFSGNDGFMEFFGYTLTAGGETINGNLFINQIDPNGGGGERTRCDFAGEYNTIANIDGGEVFGNGILTQHPENCNEYVLSGDFLNLGCTNQLEIEVFFGEESNGSEVIIGETTFTCESENGSSVEYTFRAFGGYSTAEGFIEFSEFSLTDASGNETNGTIFFEKI